MILKLLSIFFLTFLALPSLAQNASSCTAWTEQRGVSCIFAGDTAHIYKRQCANPCWQNPHGRGNLGQGCEQESICHFNNPDTFSGACSEWVKLDSVTCYDPNSQDWEQRWERACTNGLATSWCSPEAPSN